MKNERKEELKDEMKNRISMALKDPILQQGFEIICKENVELKAFRQDCVKLTEDNVVMARQRAEIAKQLTKAKDLLAKWVELFKPKLEGYPITPIQEQTEQFLSEVEK